MNHLKQLKKRLQSGPAGPHRAILRHLVQALHQGEPLHLAALYELNHEDFKLALAILGNWRLDRFTEQKERLWELARQAAEWSPPGVGVPSATASTPRQEIYC
jgi:hypothetical protein